MQNLKKLIEFYQDLGVNEILSENPINRFNLDNKKTVINAETAQNKGSAPEVIQSKIDQSLPSPAQILKENKNIFNNMTQDQAISFLARKQSDGQNNNEMQNINSIADIVKGARRIADQTNNLADLKKAVEDFDGCSLKKMATNTVFCDGNPNSKIMIIGEAPGNHEDLQGIPFCGDSGKLLNQMFLAINYKREDLYITNTLFWRPPGNRRPTDDELNICRPFVEKHVSLIAPKLIVLMGATAMTSLLEINDPIGKIHGKFLDYQNQYLKEPIKTVCLFHPSYLMRQPSKKRVAWQDLLTISDFMGLLSKP